MLQKFINFLKSHVDKAIYVWGAQGQTATTALIDRSNNTTKNKKYAKALLAKRKAEGKKNIKAFDCSGLGIRFFLDNGLMSYDTTAAGIYRLCEKLSRGDLCIGDFVFKRGTFKIVHIGYVVDIINGVAIIVHDKNSKVGVIQESISSSKWNRYGRPPFWDVVESEDIMQKGDKNKDVYQYQKLCIKAGFDVLKPGKAWKDIETGEVNGCDGSFGDYMVTVTKQIQSAYGLDQTGIANIETILNMCASISESSSIVDNYKEQIKALIQAKDEAKSKLHAIHEISAE